MISRSGMFENGQVKDDIGSKEEEILLNITLDAEVGKEIDVLGRRFVESMCCRYLN
jgi:hypothetical protein